jgi:hypothetical protein
MFLAQGFYFPAVQCAHGLVAGSLLLPFLPFLVVGFFTGRMDREGFVDIPFILAIAHPVWVVTSLIIAIALRGTGLGLSHVWSALTQATRAGIRTFAKAMH